MFGKVFATGMALLLWVIFALVVVGVGVQTFVLPPLVAGWRAQGVQALPWTWQITVDWSDFSIHRGVIVALPLLVTAVFATKSAMKRSDHR